MSAKQMRVLAAAIVFLGVGVSLCLLKPLPTLARGSQTGQNSNNSPGGTQGRNEARNPYKPARVVSSADVQFPFRTTADGVVIFDVSLDAQGAVKNVGVLQDLPPFTSAAKQSLHDWKFAASSQNNKPEDSDMLVAFVFRHSVYVANEPPFSPVFPGKESTETRSGFVPSGILSISYAAYPANTIAMGAIVVQVSVKPDGSAGDVTVIRDLPGGFAPLAIDAAKHWKFQGALRDSRPVPSKVAIAFVFSSRALNPF